VTDENRAQIWLSKAVPASVAVARLHAAGIRVVGSSTASDLARDYRGSGPGLAAALSLMAGIAVAGVTFVAALLTIASAIRRRARELWPLAQVGASTRSILGYLTLEQAMLVLPGVVAGAVAGAVAARLVTSRVAEYVVPPAAPPPAFPLHLPVALVVVLLAFVLLLPVVVLVSHRAHAAAAQANGMGDQP
jgi:ABC-type antimicrobial peptide transport system permease subunit